MIRLGRLWGGLATAGVLAVETGAVIGLGALGARREFAVSFDRLDDWARVTPPADALAAVLRWVAFAGAWWLLGGTLLYVAAAASRVPGALRAVRWAALPPVRRVVDAACAATVMAGAVLGPVPGAGAAGAHRLSPGAPSTTEVRDGRTGGPASLPPTSTPPSTPTAGPAIAPAPSPVAPDVIVAPGDNLWELAARRIATTTGRARADVTDAEIAPAWVAFCDRNRTTLQSGDPDLVFPGEVVVFPPLS